MKKKHESIAKKATKILPMNPHISGSLRGLFPALIEARHPVLNSGTVPVP